MKLSFKTPKICVPILEKRQKDVISRMKKIGKKADIVEIWLDQIEDLDLKTLFLKKKTPVLVVCKKAIEKGNFTGSYEAVSKVLIEAVENGAELVDIPIKMPEKLNKKIVQKTKKKTVVVSYHNFESTPSNKVLLSKVRDMQKRGADIVKLAVKGNTLNDTLRLILLAKILQEQKVPHILISMGKQGALSRVLTPFLGGTIMFAPLKKEKVSAPGQMTVKELKKAWNLLKMG